MTERRDAVPPDLPGLPTLERHGRLVGIKLRALVGEHLGRTIDAEPAHFPPGAALMVGPSAWVLLATDPDRRLGSALAWAVRHDADELHVIADTGTGVLARRAGEFAFPIDVWQADGRHLLAAPVEPIVAPRAPDPEHLRLADLIVEGGAVPVVEHGVVFGEVRGLEVCRVVDDPVLGTVRLEVGVGAPDREAFQIIHGDVPPVEALAGVVDAVVRYRDPDAPQHPLNRLARERLLRWRLEQDPGRVGAARLEPAEPPVARRSVGEVEACSATGPSVPAGAGSIGSIGSIGAPPATTVVVCTSGVDLEAIPYAADARLAATARVSVDGVPGAGGGELQVVVALPARDLVPMTADLAALLAQPVELVPVD